MGVPRDISGGVPESPWEVPGGSQNGGGSQGASWNGPGRPLGWFWSSWTILGAVLGGQNLFISLVLDYSLRCHVFYVFSYIFRGDSVFLRHEKPYIFLLKISGQQVAILLVFAIILERHVFGPVIFP